MNMNCSWYSTMNCVERCTSKNKPYTLEMSYTSTSALLRLCATSAAAVMRWME